MNRHNNTISSTKQVTFNLLKIVSPKVGEFKVSLFVQSAKTGLDRCRGESRVFQVLRRG